MTDDFIISNFHDLNKTYFSDNNLLSFPLKKAIVCLLFHVAMSRVLTIQLNQAFSFVHYYSFPKSFSVEIGKAHLK